MRLVEKLDWKGLIYIVHHIGYIHIFYHDAWIHERQVYGNVVYSLGNQITFKVILEMPERAQKKRDACLFN
jgi:hypothetical protein